MCAEGGQLQLNAFEPTIGYCVLCVAAHADGGGRHADPARASTASRCDRERCQALVGKARSASITALVPSARLRGLLARWRKMALTENRRVADILLEESSDRGPAQPTARAGGRMTRPARRQPGAKGEGVEEGRPNQADAALRPAGAWCDRGAVLVKFSTARHTTPVRSSRRPFAARS